jgi:hypothetical protein
METGVAEFILMRRLLTSLALTVSLHAASISFDVSRVVHELRAKHDQVPKSVRWRRVTAVMASAATIEDAITTQRGIARGACELNPVLQSSDGCGVNQARFTGLKVATLSWLLVGEELTHKLPHGSVWDRENIILNIGATALYTTISIRNERQGR